MLIEQRLDGHRSGANSLHPRGRRSLRSYRQARLRLVPLWCGVVALAGLAPWPATLIGALFATFLSFAFLDERTN